MLLKAMTKTVRHDQQQKGVLCLNAIWCILIFIEITWHWLILILICKLCSTCDNYDFRLNEKVSDHSQIIEQTDYDDDDDDDDDDDEVCWWMQVTR